jgi:hypothetical protein
MSEQGTNIVRLDAAEWYVMRRLIDAALLAEQDPLNKEVLARALQSFLNKQEGLNGE